MGVILHGRSSNMTLRHFRISIFLASLLFCCSVRSECDREYTIGYEKYGDFLLVDDADQIIGGIDYDIVSSIFNRLGCKLVWISMPWKRNLVAIKTGKIDMASGANATPERAVWANFSIPYRQNFHGLFVQKANKKILLIDNLSDIVGTSLRLNYQRGAFLGPPFEDLMERPEFKQRVSTVTDEEQQIGMVAIGRVDGTFLNISVGNALLRKKKLTHQIMAHPSIKLGVKDYVFLFSKMTVEKEFIERFNLELAALKQDGTLKKIVEQYQ